MSKVAVMRTSPETVLADYTALMHLADYESYLPRDRRTIVKLNLSWSLYFPACSTEPWQLEGVLKTLRDDGYTDIVAMENKTVVTNVMKGATGNKWLPVLKKYDVELVPLEGVSWVPYRPQERLLVLDTKVFPHLTIPEPFLGTNVLHLPTMKTHGHAVMTGAMKNAFGGLLQEARHHCHTYIHEVLVDLLTIQREIHTGMFAVTDGTVCGDGAGPRTMVPRIMNYMLASGDMVSIDAIASQMMGFQPLHIPKIKTAHDMGLGTGDPGGIEVVGEDISGVDFHFHTSKSPVIFFDRLLRGSVIEPLLFRTWFFNLCILASGVYHDYLWYPLIGRRRVHQFMETEWGSLFRSY